MLNFKGLILQIYQPKEGYCYNSDTLFLYDFSMRFIKKNSKVLEIGAGSGILGMLCARDIAMDLVMIEKNPMMAKLCRENLRINEIYAKFYNEDFLEFSFENEKFDFILSNPPFYYDGVIKSKNSAIAEARYADNLPFCELAKKVNTLLKPQGEFIFCYDARESYKVFEILAQNKMRPITLRFVHPKKDKEASLLMCRIKKGSKSQTMILPPLFTHRDLEFSDEVQEIYKRAKTWSIKC